MSNHASLPLTYSFEMIYAFFVKYESSTEVLSYVGTIEGNYQMAVEYVASIRFGDADACCDVAENKYDLLAFVGTYLGERSILFLLKSGETFTHMARYHCQSKTVEMSYLYEKLQIKRMLDKIEIERVALSLLMYFALDGQGYDL